jgi:SulP family sulfate permease
MRRDLFDAFPIFGQLRGGHPHLLVRDVVAGITVAAVLVPQAMAYAELAGVPPVSGLYASFVPLLAYALLGSSRQLALGPTATVAVLTATAIEPLSNGNATQAVALAATLALLVGGVCILGGLLRGGFVVNFLSQPVLSGYVSGAALVIAASQLGKILGYTVSGDTFFQIVVNAITNLDKIQGLTVLVAALSIGALVVLRRFAPRWPAALIVVALAITCSSLFNLSAHGVAVTGTVPSGLPSLKVPKVGIHDLGSLAFSALGVALVCYVESIAVAKAMADRLGYAVDANRELVAIGAANLGAGLFQAFPVNGSFSRSASANDAGARTQLSGVVAAVFVGLTLLFLTPLFKNLPAATLGAVVIVAVSGLFDAAGLRRAWQIRREDFAMGIIALVGVLAFGVLEGLLIAVGASLVALVYHATLPHRAVLGYVPDDDSFRDIERFDADITIPRVIVYRFDAPLFFANCRRLRDDVLELVRAAPDPVQMVVLDAGTITFLDTTASTILLQLLERLGTLNVQLVVARAHGSVRDVLDASGVADALGPNGIAPTVRAAIEARRTHDEPTDPPDETG